MSSIVYKKLTDIENLHENPFNTKQGQLVVSNSENFWTRLAREGRTKGNNTQGNSVGAGAIYWGSTISPALGHRLYPKRATVSSDVDAMLMVQINTNIADMGSFYHVIFAKAGTPLIIDFDGEIWCEEGGSFSVGAQCFTAGKLYASTLAVEVVPGA